MKATILFLAFLVFVSSTEIETTDPVLLELSKDARAEAVFATMSVQLQQQGGFDRVLALLTELVTDARKQIISTNKTWKKTAARCTVSKHALKERQDFYEGVNIRIATRAENAVVEKAQATDNLNFRNRTHALYARIYREEVVRHAAERKLLNHRINATKAAVEKVNRAIDLVKNWTPKSKKSAAFVQTQLEEVAQSFLETHSYEITVPTGMVELAASDKKVRTRLLEWLSSLRVAFLDLQVSLETVLARRVALFAKIEKELLAGQKDLEASILNLSRSIRGYTEVSKRLEASAALYAKLTTRNAALIKANTAYCRVEKANYLKVKAQLDSQITLFRELRSSFRSNYAAINRYVKRKYNNEA